jgi:hypothetical protein
LISERGILKVTTDGLEKFYEGLTKAFVEVYLPSIESSRDEVKRSFFNLLLNRNAYQPANSNISRIVEHVRDIHWGVFEILGSYESLLDAELYIRRFPFNKTRITKTRYLRYVIENHLSEVYILKERLKKYLKTIEEVYAKGTRRKQIKQVTQPLFAFNANAFGELIDARSKHVHKSRYDDIELRSIEAMERLYMANPSEEWSPYLQSYFELDYKRIRNQRAAEIAAQNQKIRNILDEYFNRLYPAIFDEQGKLLLPN